MGQYYILDILSYQNRQVLMHNKIYLYIILNLAVPLVYLQGNELDAIHEVSASLNQFALNFLVRTAEEAGESLNLALSPYTVWSLMAIIAEGARGNTANQLETTLRIPASTNKELFRRSYRLLTKSLLQSAEGIRLDVNSAVFTTTDQTLNRNFQALTKMFYGVDVIPVDFHNLLQAANLINSYVSDATNNRIQNFVDMEDIRDAEIFLTSTLFFKGQWKQPFNKSATSRETFFDENGREKGQVMMMYQVGAFPYTILSNLKAHAVELPYGNGNRMSMIVILPRKNEPIIKFLKQLATVPFSEILSALENAEQQFGEDDVQVYLPQFTISSDLNLNSILDNMGIKDVFNLDKADLLGIFPHYLYITRVIQQAKIEVNEEGTVATGAAGASFSYKSPPPKFYANRGFVYFIVDKQTKSIIFAGKVSNPNTICDKCSKKFK